MASVQFRRATKTQSRLRMALDGPAGGGKTFTALTFAAALANGGGVAVIDTERGSASKYSDLFTFDVLELDTFHPQRYIDGIKAAEDAGYDVVVIDSLSHAWEGEGGVLDLHDKATKRSGGGNSFTAWKDVTPIHRKLIDAILQSRCHIIVTMRSKMDYVQTADDKGRTVIKKVGMAPVQRAGIEFEFDIVADLDIDHNMVVTKSRCFAVADAVVNKPSAKWFETVKAWLGDGAPEQAAQPPQQPATPPAQPSAPAPNGNSNGWTTDARFVRRVHALIASECNRTGLRFPAKGEGSAYERIKAEALGVTHLAEYGGTPNEFKAAVERWFNAEVERQAGTAQPEMEEAF